MREDDYRNGVCQFAMGQLGKSDPTPYWLECGHSVEAQPALLRLAWCGVFALWCLRMAQLTVRTWELCHGFIYQTGKEPLLVKVDCDRVERGDILFRSKPFQHYAIVCENRFGNLDVIAGNVSGKVKGYQVFAQQLIQPATYEAFSIGGLIQEQLHPLLYREGINRDDR